MSAALTLKEVQGRVLDPEFGLATSFGKDAKDLLDFVRLQMSFRGEKWLIQALGEPPFHYTDGAVENFYWDFPEWRLSLHNGVVQMKFRVAQSEDTRPNLLGVVGHYRTHGDLAPVRVFCWDKPTVAQQLAETTAKLEAVENILEDFECMEDAHILKRLLEDALYGEQV